MAAANVAAPLYAGMITLVVTLAACRAYIEGRCLLESALLFSAVASLDKLLEGSAARSQLLGEEEG